MHVRTAYTAISNAHWGLRAAMYARRVFVVLVLEEVTPLQPPQQVRRSCLRHRRLGRRAAAGSVVMIGGLNRRRRRRRRRWRRRRRRAGGVGGGGSSGKKLGEVAGVCFERGGTGPEARLDPGQAGGEFG